MREGKDIGLEVHLFLVFHVLVLNLELLQDRPTKFLLSPSPGPKSRLFMRKSRQGRTSVWIPVGPSFFPCYDFALPNNGLSVRFVSLVTVIVFDEAARSIKDAPELIDELTAAERIGLGNVGARENIEFDV